MKNIHVTPHKNGWAVKSERTSRAIKILPTQKEAKELAIEKAKERKVEMLLHGKDGQIRERNTYSKKDPYPPKG